MAIQAAMRRSGYMQTWSKYCAVPVGPNTNSLPIAGPDERGAHQQTRRAVTDKFSRFFHGNPPAFKVGASNRADNQRLTAGPKSDNHSKRDRSRPLSNIVQRSPNCRREGPTMSAAGRQATRRTLAALLRRAGRDQDKNRCTASTASRFSSRTRWPAPLKVCNSALGRYWRQMSAVCTDKSLSSSPHTSKVGMVRRCK